MALFICFCLGVVVVFFFFPLTFMCVYFVCTYVCVYMFSFFENYLKPIFFKKKKSKSFSPFHPHTNKFPHLSCSTSFGTASKTITYSLGETGN